MLITFYIITSNGCQTTIADRYTPENLNKLKKLEGISHIILKDGKYINTEDKEVFFAEKYGDASNVFVFVTEDTLHEIIKGKDFLKYKRNETFLPLSNVQEVYVTRTEFSAGKTIILTVGLAIGAALIFLLALFIGYASSSHNSCPYIYSFDGNKYIYDAEPLGGVICEGLTRTDYSRLEHLAPVDGKFKLLIRNENDEQQHLDEMKLLVVNHEDGTSVTPKVDGKFFKYKSIESPISVIDENGKDISSLFKAKDDYRWQTEMNNTLNSKENQKHTLKFKFKKAEGIKSALFFFNGGITQLGSGMVKTMLELRGIKIDDWYKELNKKDAELKKLHEYILSEETYYLKVNVFENGENKVKAVIPGGGPKMDEDKVFIIPLEDTNDDIIEIVLNPPQGYWKIEQIGLIFDYDEVRKEDIKELTADFGKDNEGMDVTSELKSTDKNYYDMPAIGNSFELFFNVPKDYKKTTCELFLKTNGWYEINIDKLKPEQTELINEIFNSPGKIMSYTMLLYKKKINELSELKNKIEK